MPSSSEDPSSQQQHTFINMLAALLEKLSSWEGNAQVSKSDVVKDTRTHLLQCMRVGLTHPFTSFYSLELSTIRVPGGSQ